MVLRTAAVLCMVAWSSALGQSSRAVPARRTLPPAGVAAGALVEHVVFDSTYKRPRRIWVYTPPGYAATGHAPYDLLIAFDGDDYRDTMPLPMVLDTLLAGKHAPPFVAVLVDDSTSGARLDDLANHKRFVTFLAGQVMPWVRRSYNVTHDPRHTIVDGSSAGGLAAAFVALERPDLFGSVVSQSGAFWRGDEGSNGAPYEALAAKYSASPKRDIRFVMDVGAGETHAVLGGSGPVFIDATRRFRDVLRAKGYDVTYMEVPGGVHSPASWRTRLGATLVAATKGW